MLIMKKLPNEMRINLFNGRNLLAWKANLDIQIVLDHNGCVSSIIGYMSKSQRGTRVQLHAAAKGARN